jgi:thioredoxin 1
MAAVMEISETQFEAEVINEPLPVLVDFWAPWCGPCKMVAPILDEIAAANPDRLKVVKVNVDEFPGLAARFDVMGIPTLVFFKDGRVVDSITGAIPKQALAEKIDLHI